MSSLPGLAGVSPQDATGRRPAGSATNGWLAPRARRTTVAGSSSGSRPLRRVAVLHAALLACAAAAAPAAAQTAWDEVAAAAWPGAALHPAGDAIAIDAPYRTANDARTRIAVVATGPEGRLVDEVTLVLDENPVPVSAVVTLDSPLPEIALDVTLRVNGPTPLHVVARTTDGRLWVAEGFVKTSGQGACAAPPGTDPAVALATLGAMEIAIGDGSADMLLSGTRRLAVEVSHPSHSGMQMDQITLLYVPMRTIATLAVALDGAPYATVTGSISLSENPRIAMSVPAETQAVEVTMTDTDGTVTTAAKRLGGS